VVTVAHLLNDAAAVDPTSMLPKDDSQAEAAAPAASMPVNGGGIASPAGQGSGNGRGTSLFGLRAEGRSFVYVVDRSASMQGSGRNVLNRAKIELLASLAKLTEEDRFQLVFYNDEPSLFSHQDSQIALVPAISSNLELARDFIGGVVADGGTQHEQALLAAVGMKPDVVFLLTDADQPVLSSAQLQRIAHAARGKCTIHTIEFGLGPSLGIENFLVKLARQTGGRHTYVDVRRDFNHRSPAGAQND
jgi:hypothetical protein